MRRWFWLGLALLATVASGQRLTTVAWDASPAWPHGTTIELCGNGPTCMTGLTGLSATLSLPVNPGEVIQGMARAIPPPGYQCGEPLADCPPSAWGTVAQTWPAPPTGRWAWKKEAGDVSTVTIVDFASNYQAGFALVTTTRSVTPTSGNLLLAIGYSRNVHSSAALDGTGWTQAFFNAVLQDNTSARRTMALWYKIAGASEPNTVQVTYSPSNPAVGLSLVELSTDAVGGFSNFVLADHAVNDSGTTTVTTLATGTTGSVSGSAEYLLVGMVSARNGNSSANVMGAATWASETLSDNRYVANTTNQMSFNTAFAVQATGGAKASTATWPTTSLLATSGIAVFGFGEASVAKSIPPHILNPARNFAHLLVR
jgi:hypothetical protein